MTVICWDGKLVAADSLEMNGCMRVTEPVTKIEVRDNCVYGVCGNAALHKPMIDWVHEHNADPDKRPVSSEKQMRTLVIVWKEGRCFNYDLETPYPVECFAPDAWGCSSSVQHVIGAMDSKIDAKTAVERAIIRNNCIGGPVQVIDLHTLKPGAHDFDRNGQCVRCGADESAPDLAACPENLQTEKAA